MRLACFLLAAAGCYAQTCAPSATTSLGSLVGHTAVGDSAASNKLLSWISPYQCTVFYDFLVSCVDFFVHRMPGDGFGNPAYYRYPEITIGMTPAPIEYQNQVAGNVSSMIEMGLAWKQLTGDSNLLDLAVNYATFVLANGLTSGGSVWPSVPYAASNNSAPYDGFEPAGWTGFGDAGRLEPDKIAELGYWFVRLHQATGTTGWLTQAKHYADVLVDRRNTSADASDSPWPFRVLASTGATIVNNEYCANALGAVRLFTALIDLNQPGVHSVAEYTTARDAVWTWLLTYPITNNHWDNYYEDIAGTAPGANFSSVVPLEMARHLLENPSVVAGSLAKAQALFTLVGTTLGVADLGDSVGINEQISYAAQTTDATARYARIAGLLSLATTGSTAAAYKDTALRSMNLVTYSLMALTGDVAGQVATGPHHDPSDADLTGVAYLRASYTDVIQHVVALMGMFPEWGETGLPVATTPRLSGSIGLRGRVALR